MIRFARITAAVAPLLLAGCGLPPAVAIVSYAVDGVSYIASGKSVADHALSVAANEDCAMFRIVQGRPICHADNSEEGATSIARAGTTGANDEPADTAQRDSAFYFVGVQEAVAARAPGSWAIDSGSEIAAPPVQVASTRHESASVFPVGSATVISARKATADFDSRKVRRIVAELTDFPRGTEIYALLGKEGTLEIYAYRPGLLNSTRDLRLVARFENFDVNRRALDGVRVNGRYYRVEDIIV